MARNERTLSLDKANGKFLGVCAGLANYMGVEAMKLRLVFLVCVVFGAWFLIPIYFIAWFLLDDGSANMRETVVDNQFVRHFRTVDYRKKLYRNTREGKIFGVCAGIADYLEISVFVVRLVFLLLFFMTGFPLLLYIGAALVLDKKPEYEFERAGNTEPAPDAAARAQTESTVPHAATPGGAANARDAQAGTVSKRREFQYCARKFVALQQRLARMEAYVTSKRFRLHREFRNIS